MDYYQAFIHVSRYARWLESENRRETWAETVDRYVNFMEDHLRTNVNFELDSKTKKRVHDAIYNLDVMPSMRALMTAGPALERENVAGYNCAYMPIDSLRSFDEMAYILMNGTGVGFSVERQYVDKLPVVPESFHKSETVIKVGDSKQGWAGAFRELLAMIFAGQVPSWDTSSVRKAGERLKIFGGRASGPEPLEELFEFCVKTITNAAGRKLTPIEAHDICCKIGDIVVVGGVRRSALISFSDLDDYSMSQAKSGNWYETHGYRRLANNSVAYKHKPTMEQFFHEWHNLYKSKSGERGVFNVEAAKNQARKTERRDPNHDFRANPCSEIILRPYQFCNLSSVVIKEEDTLESLREKVEIATIIGTFQSSLTKFKYIRSIWRKNCEEERLLGVSLNGTMGHRILSGQKGVGELEIWLDDLKERAIVTNKKWAHRLGIKQSASITCQKPEGTSSQLVNTSAGGHAWHNDFFARTVRADKKDPLTAFLTDVGIPVEDDIMSPNSTSVFTFPRKAPDGAITRHDLSAIEALETWLTYQNHWCEHKPSVTITVKEDEWLEVGAWVYNHFDQMSGVSFLPYDGGNYKQAPYQDLSAKEYEDLVAQLPESIDWSILPFYEKGDTTSGTQELACVAGSCDVVSIGTFDKTEERSMIKV